MLVSINLKMENKFLVKFLENDVINWSLTKVYSLRINKGIRNRIRLTKIIQRKRTKLTKRKKYYYLTI